jgi:phospho-N-acetylmuramoyl-pentapeptide-transferase
MQNCIIFISFIDCYYALDDGTIGFVDDYIKILKKQGLKGIFKVFGQVGLGLVWDSTLFNPSVTVQNRYGKTIFSNKVQSR